MKFLGVDFGLRRVGLAISEGMFASPFMVLPVRGLKDAIQKISRFANSGEFTRIVVGLPEGKMGQVVYGFVDALKKKGFDVETADETLSGQKAVEQMVKMDTSKKARRSNDANAAAIILQNYLDEK